MEQGLLGQNEKSEIAGQGLVDDQHFDSIVSYTTVPCEGPDRKYRRGMYVPIEDHFCILYPSPRVEVLLTIPKVDATIAITMTASERRISVAQTIN